MLPHFDYSISLGTIAAMIGVIYAISAAKTKFEILLRLHTQQITSIHERMRAHDVMDERRFNEMQVQLVNLVGNVQRLVGQSEIRALSDRRHRP